MSRENEITQAAIDPTTAPIVAELRDLTELLESVPRLKDRQYRLVRELRAAGMGVEALAEMIGRSPQRVWQILAGPSKAHGGGLEQEGSGVSPT